MDHVIGIGEMAYTEGKGARLITYSLASCVAVIMFHRRSSSAAMIHYALPFPTTDMEGSKRPAYYGQTGIPLMIDGFRRKSLSIAELEVFIIGGANSINENDLFMIGKRNLEVAKTILDKNGIRRIVDSDTGGSISRTVFFSVDSGTYDISTLNIII